MSGIPLESVVMVQALNSFLSFLQEAIEMLKEKVQRALEKVRPSLQADGGDVQLVEVD